MSSSNPTDIETTIAHQLDHARRTCRAIPPLTSAHPDLSVSSAYRIQQTGIGLRLADGAHRVGHKIGLTSAAMQQQLGVDQPDYGVLLDTMVVPSGATIERSTLVAPRVEAEIAVRMTASLAGSAVTREQAQAAIGSVVPALEIIDSRIADWKISLVDTIADNASSGLAVVGAPSAETGDLAGESVRLFVDDAEVASGEGSALLGHPLESLRWLVHALAEFGAGLEAGDLVLLGAVHASVPLEPGRRYRASYARWGDVDCVVTQR